MTSKVPKHIAIILDGNRRLARRLMMKPWKGHEWGAQKVKELLEWCRDLGIKELTLYTFSIENFDRPKEEFDYLMDLFGREFENIKDNDQIHKHKIRINFIGRLYMFPKDVRQKMHSLMELTMKYDKYMVNFAMAYGGRAEVIDAVKRIAEQVKDGKLDVDKINEQTFGEHLYTDHEPELIIRTGGEKRTSNFLPWQGHYSEWFFLEKMWPEFEKEDLIQVIREYGERERRFGR